jgi:hypothetical protein
METAEGTGHLPALCRRRWRFKPVHRALETGLRNRPVSQASPASTGNLYIQDVDEASRQPVVTSRRLLAQVTKKLLGALPNAADPELGFSELG